MKEEAGDEKTQFGFKMACGAGTDRRVDEPDMGFGKEK
jgi:hypothetical protein